MTGLMEQMKEAVKQQLLGALESANYPLAIDVEGSGGNRVTLAINAAGEVKVLDFKGETVTFPACMTWTDCYGDIITKIVLVPVPVERSENQQ